MTTNKRIAKLNIDTNNGSDSMEANAIVCDRDNGTYIDYGDCVTRGSIGISGNIVTISRFGDNFYTLILEEGKYSVHKISTPYGSMDVAITTDSIELRQNELGITLYLVYQMDVGVQNFWQQQTVAINCVFEKAS